MGWWVGGSSGSGEGESVPEGGGGGGQGRGGEGGSTATFSGVVELRRERLEWVSEEEKDGILGRRSL